ncbi:serine/threonine protein kinase [Thiohalocapsa marina]|uniref:serine/threonine protein kinase n=1 Tax=Thiohalocapsa marina TaxID=424902 RepID=UPI0036DEEF82
MTDPVAEHLCPGCFADKDNANPCPRCGYDEHAPRGPLPLPHHHLLNGQFLIGRVLGKPGGFGLTYLGWDQQLHTRVAIKEYLPRDLATRFTDGASVAAHTQEDGELLRYGLTQFIGEARTLAQLDHPNIVRVRQFFEANGTAYLVMDYYDGLSLAEYLEQQGGKLPEKAAVQLMLPILDGLRAVHAKGFLHRDVKPQNIYLANTDVGGVRPILLDFGAARQAMGERSRSLSVVVSAGYAPLEQYQRKGQQGPWTDTYSAAAVLYRLVTGHEPPEAIERIPDDRLQPAADLGFSASLSDTLGEALAISPDMRPPMLAFRERLRKESASAAESSRQRPALSPHATQPGKTQPERRSVAWLLIALVAVSGSLVALWQPWVSKNGFDALEPIVADQPESSEPQAPALPAAVPEAITERKPLSPSLSDPDAITEPEPTSPPAIAVDAERLATCREHMENKRYTHPENANALLCYQAIERQDPGNAEAANAFEQMTAFYLDSGQRALRNGDPERVRDRIERLKKIDPNSLAAEQLEQANVSDQDDSFNEVMSGFGVEIVTDKEWLDCARKAVEEGEKEMREDGYEDWQFWGAAGDGMIYAAIDKCGYLESPKTIPKWAMELINEKCYWEPDAVDYAIFNRPFYKYHPDYLEKTVMPECKKVYNRMDSLAKRKAEMSRMSQ